MTDHAVSWHSGKWSSWNGTLALCCLDGCSFWKEILKIIIDIAAAASAIREVVENAQSTFTFIFHIWTSKWIYGVSKLGQNY